MFPIIILVWETIANASVPKWTVWMNQTESQTILDLFAYPFDWLDKNGD